MAAADYYLCDVVGHLTEESLAQLLIDIEALEETK